MTTLITAAKETKGASETIIFHTAKTMYQLFIRSNYRIHLAVPICARKHLLFERFLLSLPCNTAKSSSTLIVKFGSSSLVSSITFGVKTFTAKTLTRLTFASMLNSTRQVI